MTGTRWNDAVEPNGQYSLAKILGLWAAVAIPLGIMGLIVFPMVAPDWGVDPMGVGFARMATITVALMWEFVLALIIVYREEGDLRWATLRRRLWLRTPQDPKTGEPRPKLWLWLIPLLILHAAAALFVSGLLDDLSVMVLPFIAPPGEGYELGEFLMSPEAPTYFAGAWGILAIFLVMAFFNIAGEEFFWRGVMLPKMNGVFGKWDWLANGVLGGGYHLSQPWQILGGGIFMWTVFYALPVKYFRSTWFSIILHGSINVLWTAIILRLVLGLG
ncbi:CPBP family intramembrane glutamic endopeptidase [Chloroflexota bacterium]